MIERVGVIYEDAVSRGFLLGVRDRLRCAAELIPPTPAIGRTTSLTRKTARRAWRYFQNRAVQLVVLFTDSDDDRWQSERREQTDMFPSEARSVFICAVAVSDVEDWLALDMQYIASALELNVEELKDPIHRADRIKRALKRARREDEGLSEAVARIVREAPPPVFRRWLGDRALRTFYTDCRSAAKAADCETPSELDSAT